MQSNPAVVLDPSDICTVEELAKRLKVQVSTIYEWQRKKNTRGALPYFRVGRFLRFSWREVSAWMLARRDAGDKLAHIGGRPPMTTAEREEAARKRAKSRKRAA